MRSSWMLLLVATLAAACGQKSTPIEEAKKLQAAGQLDAALTKLRAAGSADAAEASRLATAWLLEAASKTTALDDRKSRLLAALDWSPTSGEAGARLCLV